MTAGRWRIPLADLSGAPRRVTCAPDPEALAAIARRLQVEDVLDFKGQVELRAKGNDVHATGDVAATLVRRCVVTLDPLEERIEETIDLRLTPTLADADEGSAEDVDLLDAPFLVDGAIDVLEILVQQTALGMDPFPRAPDAGDTGGAGVDPDAIDPQSPTHRPFAGLKDLMDGKPPKD
ncbi:MAG: hypothetical protein GC152_15910 [Alphaproteobacteria bacterium]|nr:hypothetical protein [Alphaproteobacteria bacterium]